MRYRRKWWRLRSFRNRNQNRSALGRTVLAQFIETDCDRYRDSCAKKPGTPSRAFLLRSTAGNGMRKPVTMGPAAMANARQIETVTPADLAQKLGDALQRERVVPRFVDSYVVEHSRYALQ